MTVVSREPAPDLNPQKRIYRQHRRPCAAVRPVYRGGDPEGRCYNRAQHRHRGRWYCWVHLRIILEKTQPPPACPTCGQPLPA